VILFPGDERVEPAGRAVLAVTRRERGSRWKSLASAFDINSAKIIAARGTVNGVERRGRVRSGDSGSFETQGVYPLCFLKSVQRIYFEWVAGCTETSVYKLLCVLGLEDTLFRTKMILACCRFCRLSFRDVWQRVARRGLRHAWAPWRDALQNHVLGVWTEFSTRGV
jgi:hypothetical protein